MTATALTIDDSGESASPGRLAWRRFRTHRVALASACALLGLLLLVLVGPAVSAHDPDALSDSQFAAPSGNHWFGTDDHGRDLLTRVLHGARVSLLVGIVGAGGIGGTLFAAFQRFDYDFVCAILL